MQLATSYEACCEFLDASFLFIEQTVKMEDYPYDKYQGVLKSRELRTFANLLKTKQEKPLVESITKLLSGLKEEQKKIELICLSVFLNKNLNELYPYQKRSIPHQALSGVGTSDGMLDWLLRFYKENVCTSLDLNDSEIHHLVKSALQEVEFRFGDNSLSLAELSKAYNVSATHLGKIFKAQTGTYFNDYLMNYRLKKAELYLADYKLNMSQISDKVGFASQSYFTRIFRHNFGMSPLEYRRKCYEEYEKYEREEKKYFL